MGGVRHRLLARTAPEAQGGLLYVGELHSDSLLPKMDHLVCFLPGGCDRAAPPPPSCCAEGALSSLADEGRLPWDSPAI